ncbi:extensin family protein [Candidatus Poriferisodalis sp.]|uniref:extensin family protein n=1 Tax=Candidatus Poriferisodalis sp. TaxID=3101277 RepID=UPI003B5AC7D6
MTKEACDHSCGRDAPVTIVPVPSTEGAYRFRDPEGDLKVDLRSLTGSACAAGFNENSSEDFGDYNASDPKAPTIHPCLHSILDNCIANLDWFSSRYGIGYGRLEIIGYSGVSRPDFRFKHAVDGKTVTLYEANVRERLSKSVAEARKHAATATSTKGDTATPTTVIYPAIDFVDNGQKRVTQRQLEWLRRADIYGSTFAVKGSWHYHDRAIDITWIGWNEATLERPIQRRAARPCRGRSDVQSSTAAYRRMVTVEACLRKFFGTVLNRNYDDDHADHFHVDDGACVGFNLGLKSHVVFLQDCIEAFTDVRLSKDNLGRHFGTYDATTKKGYRALMSDLGMERLQPEKYGSHYWLFLNYIMMHGFANERAGFYRYGDTTTSPIV